MGIFANLKTSTRVALSFGAVAILLVVMMAVSVVRMNGLAGEIENFAGSRVPKIINGSRAIETLLQNARQMRNVLVLDDENQIRTQLGDIGRNQQQLSEVLAQIAALPVAPTEASLLQEITKAREAYEPHEKSFIDLAKKGDYSTAKDRMIDKVVPAEAKYIEALSAFIEFQSSSSAAEARSARDVAARARLVIIALTLAAIAICVLTAVGIVMSLRSRLGEKSYAAGIANRIAAGDLTQEVHAREGDDAIILKAMKRMRDDLARTVGEIRRAAESVGTGSRQIAMGNTELAGRTEEQASSLEETAASMEELAGTVKQTSDNARAADTIASNASKRAEVGGDEVARVVTTMKDIQGSASKIGEITSVIDGIAFQTNILALNAAVEAARAGEQGRGFAVVASEVRSLAQRSANAAKEIKALIGDSLEKVGTGVQLVERAGTTIGALVVDVKQVSDLMRSIADASAEQSRGVQQVNKTVTEMDKVVQENASAVQESVAAAESMRQQAESLMAAVGSFRLLTEAEEPVMPREPAPMRASVAKRTVAPVARGGALPAPAAAEEEWQQF